MVVRGILSLCLSLMFTVCTGGVGWAQTIDFSKPMARMNVTTIGAGVAAAASCTTANDSAITITNPSGAFDFTGDAAGTVRSITGATENISGAVMFVISAAYTITEYKVIVADDSQAANFLVAIFNDEGDNTVNFSSMVADSQISTAHGDIDDDPTYETLTLTLPTPISLSAGTYWLVFQATQSGGGDFNMAQVTKTGSRALIANAYYNNYAYQVGIWGCAQ